MGAFIIGLPTTRYVLANPPVANLSRDARIGRAMIAAMTTAGFSPNTAREPLQFTPDPAI
jgi:hypothetical protein